MSRNSFFLVLGPAMACLSVLALALMQQEAALIATVAVTLWTIIWWISEPIPIPVSSLLPLALLPMLGVLDGKGVALAYGSPLILLLLGGFLLSKAMESSGTHRKIAFLVVHWVGASSARRLVFAFMIASAGLSMWISNTATTLMLLPVAMAVIERASTPKLALPLILGLAYAASVGGVGTPIGTPPNLIFMQIYTEFTGNSLSFFDWMSIGIPVVILFIPLMALWLTRKLKGEGGVSMTTPSPWTTAQKRVLWVFGLTALAWMTRSSPFGGWSHWLNTPLANDASVAFIGVIVLFIIPDGRGGRVLDWDAAVKIPWGVLLLFAGGLSMAAAFQSSGLSAQLGALLSGIEQLPLILMMLLLALAVSFMTEATSNTASTTLLMPILASAALGAGIDPLLLMVPAALSASCAFMLPVATAPNSVVYGSGFVQAEQMAREGFILNWIGAVVITLVCFVRLN